MSKFIVIGDKFLFRDGKIIITINSPIYVKPIFEKIKAIEFEKGTEFAIELAKRLPLNARLASHVRIPEKVDFSVINGSVKTPPTPTSTVKGIGTKHTCTKCSAKFYDLMGKIKKCPHCETPVTDMLNIC